MRRSATIQGTGALGKNIDDIMTLNFTNHTGAVAGDYYHPNAVPPLARTGATIATNGDTWIAGRNYTAIAAYAVSHSNADDANCKYHLYVNGVDTTQFVQIANGQSSGSNLSMNVNINAGDQLCWKYDAAGDSAEGNTAVSLQLNPR